MFQTERLLLRRWKDSDRLHFARLNTDPQVTEFLGGPLSRQQSDAMIKRAEEHFRVHDFGPYAAEILATGEFAGFIALMVPSFQAHFTPCVEIGWRLAASMWGQGYATEGAKALLRHAFSDLGLRHLVSFTVPANVRSRRIMEKLGMTRDPAEDFDHPNLSEDDPLRRHVLYRLSRETYRSNAGG
jgi:RimJ/RimL family protein N-acetyltransferase